MGEMDLLTRVLFRLQDCKQGQTVAQLSAYLLVPEALVLATLHHLRTRGEATIEGNVWKFKGHETAK